MTPENEKLEKQRLYLKATALNKIRKIYNPHYKFPYSFNEWGDWDECDSQSEQREDYIRRVITELESDLTKLKHK